MIKEISKITVDDIVSVLKIVIADNFPLYFANISLLLSLMLPILILSRPLLYLFLPLLC